MLLPREPERFLVERSRHESFGFASAPDTVFVTGSSQETVKTWGFRGAYTHNWDPYWNTAIYGAYAAIMYNDTAKTLICGAGGVGGSFRTAFAGGDLTCADGNGGGCGVVYKLDIAGHLSVLHAFAGGMQGNAPLGLVSDAAGNLYGATLWGGNSCTNHPQGCGLMYKIDTAGNFTVLYRFAGADGGRDK